MEKSKSIMTAIKAMTGTNLAPLPPYGKKLSPKGKKPYLTLMPNHFGERRTTPTKCRVWTQGQAFKNGRGWYQGRPIKR